MFKYGVTIIREYAFEMYEKLEDIYKNEKNICETAQEKEAILFALQFLGIMREENNGIFEVVPNEISKMQQINISILETMGKKDDFYLKISCLLKLLSLKKINVDEKDSIENTYKIIKYQYEQKNKYTKEYKRKKFI